MGAMLSLTCRVPNSRATLHEKNVSAEKVGGLHFFRLKVRQKSIVWSYTSNMVFKNAGVVYVRRMERFVADLQILRRARGERLLGR